MPTHYHNAVATWVRQEQEEARARGFFTRVESRDMQFMVGSRFDSFPAPWANLYKDPDGAWVNRGELMPSVVVETGYTESWPKVQEDRDLWLQGGAPFVNVVVLVKFNKRSNGRVAAYIEVHRPGGQQGARVDIFPSPPPGTPPQQIIFHRRDFYTGGVVPQGHNPNGAWAWDLDELRFFFTPMQTFLLSGRMEDCSPADHEE